MASTFAGVIELPERELADALEQLVPGRMIDARLRRDHRLVDQPRDQLQYVESVDLAVGCHTLGGLETEIRGERSEASKHRAFPIVEEIVAPFDGSAAASAGDRLPKRSLAVRIRKRSSRRVEICPADIDLIRAAASSSASGMPSRRRQIATTSATLVGPSSNAGSTRSARSTKRRTASNLEAPRSVGIRRRERERRHAVHDLAGDRQPFTTGRDDVQIRARDQQVTTQRRNVFDDLFAVVEDQQDPTFADRLPDGRGQRDIGHRGDIEAFGHLVLEDVLVQERCQLHETKPIRERTHEAIGHLESETSLARPTGSGQGDESVFTEQRLHIGDLLLAADEAGELSRECVTRPLE